jgi:hypothetical protein
MKRYFLTGILILFCFSSLIKGQGRSVSLGFIKNKLESYRKAVPWEEIYIHTDRNEYIAGEQMWFNVYVIDRQSNKPSPYSRIVYVELINRYNQPVVQKRIGTENGTGPGQLALPDSLSSGNYMLRAYTGWMKNFLPANCFMKEINIYNTLRDQVFKARSPLFPQERRTEVSSRFQEEEFMLTTKRRETGDMDVLIHTNDRFRSWYGNIYYLIMETRGNIDYASEARISGDSTGIKIPVQNISPGINHITFFATTGETICERYVYTPAMESVVPDIRVPGECGTREEVLIKMNTMQNMSISVVPDNETGSFPGISDYMVFGTEFGILPEGIRNRRPDEIPPGELDEFLGKIKSNWINWSVILSDDLPSTEYGFEDRYHFITGHLVNRKTLKGNPGRNVFLSTPSKIPVFQYSVTDSAGKFLFYIPVTSRAVDIVIQPESPDADDVIRMESSFAESSLKPDGSLIKEREIPDYVFEMSSNYQTGKIYEISSSENHEEEAQDSMATKRFYGKPDIELVMDDYIKLPVMQEVFFELIPGVSLKKRKADYEITMNDPVDDKPYNKPPGLFVDGVFINDASVIAAMDPDIVEKIDVVNEAYYVGDYYFEGIINVITRAGDFGSVTLPDHALRIPYRVTQPVSRFRSPDYSNHREELARIPDFRNTLYWNPSLKRDNEGKISAEFWSSDLEGRYVIDIEGYGADGTLISERRKISVVENNR